VLVRGSVVVESISGLCGVKLQEASSGSPAQEIVTSIGCVNVDVNSSDGVMLTVTVPASPGVRIRELEVDVPPKKFEVVTVNSHCVATLTATAGVEVDVA
jgi:hypothetical protein